MALALLLGAALVVSGVLALLGASFVPVLAVSVVVALILAVAITR